MPIHKKLPGQCLHLFLTQAVEAQSPGSKLMPKSVEDRFQEEQ